MPEKKTTAATSRRRLGRGLKSLLSDPVQVQVPPPDADSVARNDAARDVVQNPNKVTAASEDAARAHRSSVTDTSSEAGEGTIAPSTGVRPTGSASASPAPASPTSRASDRTDLEPSPPASDLGDAAGPQSLRLIRIDRLRANPDQPRRHFDEDALAALGESIRTAGMMQPIVVRPVNGDPQRYEIVAGERRYRAASRIGLAEVPVIVHEIDDRTAAEFALIENLQREDLNPIERAVAFRRLADEYGMTHEAIATAVGLDRASVSNHLRLLGLDDATREDLRQGTLGMGHGRALLGVAQLAARRSLAEQAVRDGWSVRELEKRIRAFNRTEGDAATPPDAGPDPARSHLEDLERRLGDHLGTRVQVRQGRRAGTGEVRIRFFSHEDFEGLLERVGFRVEG